MRAPRYQHSTKVSKAYLARIEAERLASLTPEDRARQNEWAEHLATLTAAGHKFGPPEEPRAGVGDDWADDQWRQMTKPVETDHADPDND